MPKRPRAAIILRNFDETHRRREVRARRHPIPDLIEVVLQVLSRTPPSTRHPPRPLLGSPSLACTPPTPRFGIAYDFASGTGSSPCGLTASTREPGPFAPPALPGFVATTSPSAPAPRIGTLLLMGSTTWISPFASGRQVPTFHTRACAGLTPPSCRPPLGQSAGTPRAASQANDFSLVSMTSYAFDTSSAVHLRSSSQHPPDGYRPPFPSRSPPRPLTEQLPAVWTLRLHPESEGPTLISCAARLQSQLLHCRILSAPSWRTKRGAGLRRGPRHAFCAWWGGTSASVKGPNDNGIREPALGRRPLFEGTLSRARVFPACATRFSEQMACSDIMF